MPYGESLSEMAVDRGSIESNGRKAPICEIDIELICGRISDIFGLPESNGSSYIERSGNQGRPVRGCQSQG